MSDQKKTEQPSAEDWQKWGEEIYTPWYEKQTEATADSNPNEPPPPPPGPIKP